MRTVKTIDGDVRTTMTRISSMYCEIGGSVKKLPITASGTRGYMFKTAKGGICVVSLPEGLSRNIITVANPNKAVGVDVPKYTKGNVGDYLTDNIHSPLMS